MTVTFANLGIQCVKKKDIEEALRIREEIRVDPFRTGFDHKRQPTSIDLNAVRLCFQVFLEGAEKGKFNVSLPPVVSDPIYDKKAMSDLVICKLSTCSASVAGGTEMMLFCEKVAKEDIQVRFFEERDGQLVWEGFGDFQPTHVHKQVGIAFRTPSYRMQQVDQPVQIFIQLKRPSDGSTSDPLPFQLLPLGSGRPAFWSLRKAFARKKADYNTFGKILATEAALLSSSTPKLSRTIDEFNNNDLETKRSHHKISALRALNDLYHVKNGLDSRNGNDNESKMDSTNTNNYSRKDTVHFENNDITVVAEKKSGQQPTEFFAIKSNVDLGNPGTVNDNEQNNANIIKVNINESAIVPDSTDVAKGRSDWFDYSEVGKWVQRGQDCLKEKDVDDGKNDPDDSSKSLNELLNQVAEIDQIYADTHTKLLQAALEQNLTEREMDVDVCDNQTYTSLQMAMKNPVELFDIQDDRKYEDVVIPNQEPMITISPPPPPPPLATKRDVTREFEERLPPLPPKRIRKMPSMPALPRPTSSQTLNESSVEAPHKNLPSLPGTLPKQSKQSLFSKLFAKKPKKGSMSDATRESSRSLNVTGSLNSLTKASAQDLSQEDSQQLPRPSMASVTSVKSLRLDGDETPPYGVELTEAEHYALYTAMAPHATASEFDEMSFYYSPVEGGKILTDGKET
ncbi:embryonic polarity protein dorsal-like isoform X2 [Cephus cinctus]|nr:embryonic polarity protein dorsal-like isoform X2 [Cephus cinctus]